MFDIFFLTAPKELHQFRVSGQCCSRGGEGGGGAEKYDLTTALEGKGTKYSDISTGLT